MKEITLFVSSTFSDMIDERELLVRSVFPRVKRFCKERGLIFRTIDLRWGITREQADDLKQTIDICLKRVNDSVPLFLAFVGQRYGWKPTDPYLKAINCDHPEAIEEFKERSATELEIVQALYSKFYDGPKKRCLFFIKSPSYLDTIPEESIKKKYVEEDETNRNKLNSLRKTLIDGKFDCSEYTSKFVSFEAPSYLGTHDTTYSEKLLQTHFECDGVSLADKLYDKLTAAILEVTADIEPFTPIYSGERNQHYLLNQYRHSTPIDSVDSYLKSCLATKRGSIRGLYMPELQGKSSALARLIDSEQEQNPWIFYRFLGGDPNTKTIRGVLHTLAEEICARFNKSFDHKGGHIYDLTVLQECLNTLLAMGEDSVIVLDGLNKTKNTYLEWLEFFNSLSMGHVIFSTNNQTFGWEDTHNFDTYQDEELSKIIRYHFEQFGKSITNEQAETLINISQGKLVNIMHIIRYLVRFSTYKSIDSDILRLSNLPHLDAIVSIDDEYSKLQPLNIHWDSYSTILQNMLSYTTYTLMICRSGVTFEELSEIIFDIVSKLHGSINKELIDEFLVFELHLLSEELEETDGLYSIKDPFYADYLIFELNRSDIMRSFYFERVVENFCRFAASKNVCPRHFDTVNEILENVATEDLERFLSQYFLKNEYIEAMINTMDYSYLTKSIERYYVQSLGWSHLLNNTPENRYQIRRAFQKISTPQNEIGLIRKLILMVPLGFRYTPAAAFSYVSTIMEINGFDQKPQLELTTAFYSAVSHYPKDEYKKYSACVKLDDICSYQKDKTTIYLDVLYTCGNDDRVYAYNLESGECDTVIQLQKGDQGLCLFYFEYKLFIVGRKLIYLWDVIRNTKQVFDYEKNPLSKVKAASTSKNGDVAFWFESGLIKLYRRMQPILEIDSLIGNNIEYVWSKEIDGNMITIALVKGDGYYIFKNEEKLFVFGKGINNDLYSERFAGITGNNFYYATSHGEYSELNLLDLSSTAVPLSINGTLRIEGKNIITADANNRITTNGEFTGLNNSIIYSELTEKSLYLIDEKGFLRIY